jgi:hypothetical protein
VKRVPDLRPTGAPLAERVETISRRFLGCPYDANGLVGSAETPEVFVAPLDRFDCVTYVETVYALAAAADEREFEENLRALRYDGGVVAWRRRNHYMTSWLKKNARAGWVTPVAAEGLAVVKERVLTAVPGLAPLPMRFRCVPKSAWKRFAPRLATGDLILFASTKPSLDVFHCGLVVGDDNGVLAMRHASQRLGGVFDEDLEAFRAEHRMAGVLAARPLPRGAARA